MKSRRLGHGLVGLALVVLGVAATPAGAESLITTSTTSDVFNSGSKFYTHCVNGHYWVALRMGSSILLYSSSDGDELVRRTLSV